MRVPKKGYALSCAFFHTRQSKLSVTFYNIIKIIERDAKSVHQAITNQLKKDGLKIENIIGIGVDGTNVMVGKHNSVIAILKRELPDLIIVKCVSHSLHLCSENATEL